MPYSDVDTWVSTARASGGTDSSVEGRGQGCRPDVCFKENVLHLCTFSSVSNFAILIIFFYLAVFRAIFVHVLVLLVAILRQA